MTRTLDDVRKEALQLPAEHRLQLIQALHESVMTDEERDVEQSWIEESERRYQDWKAGRAVSIPGEEALTRLREKYGSDSVRASRRR